MIKTNLITGFLGSGKTTTLRHLLAHKPANEKWAILVNEFGEIGIDGALLAGQGAAIKEIPGGCLCCVAGLPMQIGLNMLISREKPDRLLIEPTGLGHPKQVLSMLSGEHYETVLDLRATLCVLDARQLADPRYRDNENFRDQLAAADVLIANKADVYQPADHAAFATLLAERPDLSAHQVVAQGAINPELLDLPCHQHQVADSATHNAARQHAAAKPLSAVMSLQSHERWRRAENQGQGYYSCGWIFDHDTVFDMTQILEWARTAPVQRAKGMVRIAGGTLRFNRQQHEFEIETADSAPADSRVELIDTERGPWNSLQTALLAARQ